MAGRLKVDDVRYELNPTTGMLSVWLYNDASYYEKRPNVSIATCDFGRHYDERGLTTDRKAKLDKGLYRKPFRDGWKYRLNIRLHPMMYETLMRYIRYGWTSSSRTRPIKPNSRRPEDAIAATLSACMCWTSKTGVSAFLKNI